MAIQMRVSIVGTEELKRALARMNPEENARIWRSSFKEMARELVPAAVAEIAHGRSTAPPLPDRLTNRHGGRGLVGSIGINDAPLPKAIEVGTHLGYGAIHEEGLGRYPERPFLQPALDKWEPKFTSILVKNWKREGGL